MSRFARPLAIAALALLTTLLAISGPVPSAHAQEATAPDFDTLLDRGVQHYQARQYEQAIEVFRQAFALRPEPEIVYNIARSYERLARPTEAIAEYERFVALPGTTSELRTRAHASIRALRAELAASESAPPEPAVTPTPTPAPVTAPVEPPPPPPEGGSALGPVGWTMFGVGAVSVGVGVAFGVLTIDRNDAFLRAAPRSEQQIQLRDDVKESALAADILLIGGGVIAATGLVLAIVDATSSSGSERAASDGPSVAVLPYAGADSGGVTVLGSF